MASLLKPAGSEVAVWYWNTFCSYPAMTGFRKAKSEWHFFSFDGEEAVRHGAEHLDQFFPFDAASTKISTTSKRKSAFFVGYEKGRWGELCQLSESLCRFGYECDFNVMADGSAGYEGHPEWMLHDPMPYDKALRAAASNDVIVDFAKPGQTGMTVRCLEALQYGKKIITNNPLLADDCVWNSRNAFVVRPGALDEDALGSFLERGYDASRDDELKHRYSMKRWLEQIAIKSLGVDGVSWPS